MEKVSRLQVMEELEQKISDLPSPSSDDLNNRNSKRFDFSSLVCSTSHDDNGTELPRSRRFSPIRSKPPLQECSPTPTRGKHFTLEKLKSPTSPMKPSVLDLIQNMKLDKNLVSQLDAMFQKSLNMVGTARQMTESPAHTPVKSVIKSPRKIRKRLHKAFQTHRPEEAPMIEPLVYQVRTGFVDEKELLRYLSDRFKVSPKDLISVDYDSCQVQFSQHVEKVGLPKVGEGNNEEPELQETVFEKPTLGEPAPAPQNPSNDSSSKRRRKKKKKRRRMKRLSAEDKKHLYEWREDLDPSRPLIVGDKKPLASAALPPAPQMLQVPSAENASPRPSQGEGTQIQRVERRVPSGNRAGTSLGGPGTSSASRQLQLEERASMGLPTQNAPKSACAPPPAVLRSPLRRRTHSTGSPRGVVSRGRRVSDADDPFQGLNQLRNGLAPSPKAEPAPSPRQMKSVEVESWRSVLMQLGARAKAITESYPQGAGVSFEEPIRKVLRSGFPLDTPSSKTKNTVLFDAIEEGHDLLVQCLVQSGAKLQQKSPSGLPDSALHFAIARNRVKCVRTILERDQNQLAQRDKTGQLPMHVALSGLNEVEATGMVTVLLDYGAKVSSTDAFLRNCFHYACERGFIQPLDLLLKQDMGVSATLNAQDFSGCTPLHVAAKRGSITCINLLIESGATANTKNLQGKKPLDVAIAAGHHTCSTVLFRVTEQQ